MNYNFFYKKKLEEIDEGSVSSNFSYDLFLSAFDQSERVVYLFDNIKANTKHWLIFPEYQFEEIEIHSLAANPIFDYSRTGWDEGEILLDYFSKNENDFQHRSVGIDITGMPRPYIVFLVRLLKAKGIKKIDFIYSEPKGYKEKEETSFSSSFSHIRDIKGCSGSHNPETNNDLLIVGSGFDFHRVSKVAKEKKEAKKVQLLGFPSLQADMFQQNILRSYKSEEEISSREFDLDSNEIILAPANDPFVTAELISDFIKQEERRKKFTNYYFSPLSTKSQTLGIALYFVFECLEKPASVIFPFCDKYFRNTSSGISKIWSYTVEFS